MASSGPRWDAVVLLQMGGPATLDEVEPFLRNLFSDPDLIRLPRPMRPFQGPLARLIARRRAPLVVPRYEQIGGGSPILRITNAQAAGLAEQLGVPVHVAMRYTRPNADDAAKQLATAKARRVLVLPLYPHWSGSTTGSSIQDFLRAARQAGVGAEFHAVQRWGAHPGYVGLLAEFCTEAVQGKNGTHLLLSAHSLPQRYVDDGDPYPKEVEETVRLVRDRLDGTFRSVRQGYQSAVGPVQWIGPTTEERLKAMAAKGAKSVALAPLGFVGDHIETLYDLDILYRGQAMRLGVDLHRVPSFNDDPRFLDLLADLARGPTEVLPPWTK